MPNLLHRVDPYLIRMLGECKPTPSGVEYRFNCPKCVEHGHTPDTKFRLYVNVTKGKYNCIRCGKPANPNGFFGDLKYLYGSDYQPAVNWSKWNSIRSRLLGEEVDEADPLVGCSTTLEWFTKPIMDVYSDAFAYMRERTKGIPQKEMEGVWSRVFRMGKGKHCTRLFLIDWYRNEPRYWNARAIYKEDTPKYLNVALPRYNLLFNQEHIEKTKPDEVVINEGMLSAMHAGANAVASYGRVLTDAQLHILARMPCRRFYQVAEQDREATRDAWNNAKELSGLGREVFVVSLKKDQDPASMGREAFLKHMHSESVEYSLKNRMHATLGRENGGKG